MTIETWIAFCAATLAFVLLPGPLASLIARYAQHKGRWTTLVTVPAVSLGLGAAFAVAGLPILIVATALPGAVEPLAWLGLAYVSVFSMLVGFVFWYRGLALGGIAGVGQLQLLQPFLGLALAAAAWVLVSVRGVNRSLEGLTAKLGDGAARVLGAAASVAHSSQSLSSGAAEQAASLEETASSMEELTSTVKQNAENARQAN